MSMAKYIEGQTVKHVRKQIGMVSESETNNDQNKETIEDSVT